MTPRISIDARSGGSSIRLAVGSGTHGLRRAPGAQLAPHCGWKRRWARDTAGRLDRLLLASAVPVGQEFGGSASGRVTGVARWSAAVVIDQLGNENPGFAGGGWVGESEDDGTRTRNHRIDSPVL